MSESLRADDGVYLGFDFGYKRIGVSVGQHLTCCASPLATLQATAGVPSWDAIKKLIKRWGPLGFIVGLPTCIDGQEQYTTHAAREFARQLEERFKLSVYLVDERLSTVEAREQLFARGGYHKLKSTEIDSIAACIILEQWLRHGS